MSRKKHHGFSIKVGKPRPPKERLKYRVTFAERRRINNLRISVDVWAAGDEDPRALAEALILKAYGITSKAVEYIDHAREFDLR